MANIRNRQPVPAAVVETNPITTAEPVLSFDDFFTGTDDLRRVELTTKMKDGKPGVVYIQSIPAKYAVRNSAQRANKPATWAYEMISLAVVDANRNRIFDTPEKAKRLEDLDLATFTTLQQEVLIKNGMMDEKKPDSLEGEEELEEKNE